MANKLCCVLDVWARCPMCDFVTCEECTSDGYDNHTIGTMIHDEDTTLWWFCTPTQTPIQWRSTNDPELEVSTDEHHPYVWMINRLHEEAIEEDERRNIHVM